MLALIGGLWLTSWAGCSRDVRLADYEVPSVTVKPVSHYGVSLDKDATPEQVVYVLLRAIRDDFLGSTQEEREAALDKQFDISAANVIEAKNRSGLTRDEFVYNVVHRWTPTVSHYVHDFDTERETVIPRLVRRNPKSSQGGDAGFDQCEVAMEVDDPSGDPNARAVMIVWLARDNGFWRVVHLGFDPTARSVGN